jgi:hypothetical protein
MATKRYSGNITVSINYVDSSEQYKANVSVAGKREKTVYVRPRASSRYAVDDAKAFDSAAIAAIAFAEHDGLDVSGADHTDSGIAIHRRKPVHAPKVPVPRGFARGSSR